MGSLEQADTPRSKPDFDCRKIITYSARSDFQARCNLGHGYRFVRKQKLRQDGALASGQQYQVRTAHPVCHNTAPATGHTFLLQTRMPSHKQHADSTADTGTRQSHCALDLTGDIVSGVTRAAVTITPLSGSSYSLALAQNCCNIVWIPGRAA